MSLMKCATALLLAMFVCFSILIAQDDGGQNNQIVAQPKKGKGILAIKAARLIDGTGKATILKGVVVVTDDKITAVGSAASVAIPAGAKVIDLGDATLLPGFIDVHTHVIWTSPG